MKDAGDIAARAEFLAKLRALPPDARITLPAHVVLRLAERANAGDGLLARISELERFVLELSIQQSASH